MENDRIILATTGSQQTALNITVVSGDRIDFSYRAMPNNRPATYGNVVYIWQNGNQVPWKTLFLNKFAIQTDTQSGSGSFGDLNVTNLDYILGYAVGSDPMLICSTAYVPPIGDANYQYFQSNLSINNIGPTSLSVNYNTPTGYQPLAGNNWAGIWEGDSASYNNSPKWCVAASQNAASGTIGFNNIALRRGWTYTVAWFMGGWEPTNPKLLNMACSVTFTNK
jgi:hypothetical protein